MPITSRDCRRSSCGLVSITYEALFKDWAEELLFTERGSGGGAPQNGADRCSLSPPSPCRSRGRGRGGNFWCPVMTYENAILRLAPSSSTVSALWFYG